MSTLLLTLALSMPADAGKLAEGFRGTPYGPAENVATAPLPECVPDPRVGVKWQCPIDIGGVPTQVAYMVDQGLFYGVGIEFQLGYEEALAFRNVLTAAYGPGTAKSRYAAGALDDWLWADGEALASFSYNQFSHAVVFVAFNRTLYQQMQQGQAADAAKAVGDL